MLLKVQIYRGPSDLKKKVRGPSIKEVIVLPICFINLCISVLHKSFLKHKLMKLFGSIGPYKLRIFQHLVKISTSKLQQELKAETNMVLKLQQNSYICIYHHKQYHNTLKLYTCQIQNGFLYVYADVPVLCIIMIALVESCIIVQRKTINDQNKKFS